MQLQVSGTMWICQEPMASRYVCRKTEMGLRALLLKERGHTARIEA